MAPTTWSSQMSTPRTSIREVEGKSAVDAVFDISWSQSVGLAILLTIALVFAHAAAERAGPLLFATSCAAGVIALAGAAVLREKQIGRASWRERVCQYV